MNIWENIENQLKERLETAYQITFQRINQGQNLFVQKRKDGKPRFTEPTTQEPEVTWGLFPKEGAVSIIEVLNTIQQKVNFTDSFQHFAIRNQVVKPDNSLFFAAILAYGAVSD